MPSVYTNSNDLSEAIQHSHRGWEKRQKQNWNSLTYFSEANPMTVSQLGLGQRIERTFAKSKESSEIQV